MGNLQSEPKSKIRKKLGKKKGKHEGTEEHFTSLVPEQQTPDKIETSSICKKPTDLEPSQNVSETLINFSQNRSYLNKFSDDKIDTPQSSSESYFTDPLTPITQNEKTAETTSQQNFLHDLTLNSFKLNEYRARHEEEKSKKLSKLGVSKTSQISLESDPFECFMTDNVEIISQIQCDSEFREASLDNDESFERPQTLMKQENDCFSGTKMSESFDHGVPEYKRNMSVPLDISEIESCVKLKKASSFSLSRTELDSKITKPKFVPEKLDFQLYQKFEGYMLVNWYLSEFTEKNLISDKICNHDLKLVAIQFCTHLLAAGVLKQLPDKDVPLYNIFKPDCMYFWTHSEAPAAVPQTPGRLSKVFWPPTSPLENFSPSSVNETMFTISPEEVNVGKQEMRKSTRDVEILLLEEEIKRLKQEIEKYKTLDEIQTLTKNAVIDFSSPVESLNIEEKFAERIEEIKVDSTTQTEFQEFDLNKVCENVENTNTDITTQTELKEFVSRSSSYDEMKKSSPPIQAPDVQFSTRSATPVSTLHSSVPPPPPPLPPPLSSMVPVPPIPPPLPPPLSSMVPVPPIPPPFPPTVSSGSHPPLAPSMSAVPPPPPAPSSFGIPPPPGMPYTPHMSDNSGSKEPMPLPPPPLGGWNAQKAALKKPPVAPKVPMKPLYWTRIVASPNETESPRPGSALWKEINEISLNELSDFEELFSRQVVTKKPSVKKQLPTSKATAVKLLDSKRSQNVGILAQSLKIDLQEIENAVYNFDTSIVGLETLQQIYEARATREELELIKSHMRTLPNIPLDKPEQFLYELAEISNFAERISCLMFQVEFDDSINTIGHTLANFKTTCDFLTNNVELKEVIAIILTLGNYMNGGNISRGQADGFGLEILSKLRDVKSNDSKITLLHYVVKVYMRNIQHPIETNLRLPVPEPGDIKKAAAVNFDDLRAGLRKLQRQLDGCSQQSLKILENSMPENIQPFKDKITIFLEQSIKQMATEFDNVEECHKQFIATMEFYLFKPKIGTLETFSPSSFFELWLPFCEDFKNIFKKEVMRLEKEKIQEIKRKEHERVAQVKKIKERENGLKAKIKRTKEKLQTNT